MSTQQVSKGNNLRDTRGFSNPFSLCYRNATLVLLLHTIDLVHCANKHDCCQKPCLLCAFHDFSRKYWYGDDSETELAMESFWAEVRRTWDKDPNEQQDVPEFMGRLIQRFCESWPERLNPVLRNYVEKRYICPACGESGRRIGQVEELSMLFAGIPVIPPSIARRKLTVVGAIENLMYDNVSVEMCTRCRTEHFHIRESLTHAPSTLLVQLNRIVDYSTLEKSLEQLYFDETLPMPAALYDKRTQKRVESFLYELYAVIFHQGNTSKQGHYTAAVKAHHGRWRFVNDNKVKEVSFEDISDEQRRRDVYVLAYRRVSPVSDFPEDWSRVWLQAEAELSGVKFAEKINVSIRLPLDFPGLWPDQRQFTLKIPSLQLLFPDTCEALQGHGKIMVKRWDARTPLNSGALNSRKGRKRKTRRTRSPTLGAAKPKGVTKTKDGKTKKQETTRVEPIQTRSRTRVLQRQ